MARSNPPSARPVTVACVTCYFSPDYIRSMNIRTALAQADNVRTIIIKNRSTGVMRYPQVLSAMLRCRLRDKPDVWVLNFRGYELLPLTLLLAGRKPVVYDELINPVLVVREHRRLKRGPVRWLMALWDQLGWVYNALVRRCAVILSDTEAQAAYGAAAAGDEPGRYQVLPVAADEHLFTPRPQKQRSTNKTFEVFFYGTGTQPLHGVETIIKAARLLADDKHIRFTIVGGKGRLNGPVEAANAAGASIKLIPWLPWNQLPRYMRRADLCLGGPFGDTEQARLVITGKTMQMLACAAPVVVGRSPATDTYFIDRHISLVVPQGDAVSLADSIHWAVAHPKELAAIAHHGRRLYEAQLSQQRVNDALAAVLQRVTAH